MVTYQYPEEEWELKCVLEEDEVDQVQDDSWLPEPEVLVWWLHNQIALDRRLPRGYIVGKLSDDVLQLGANSQQKLQEVRKCNWL